MLRSCNACCRPAATCSLSSLSNPFSKVVRAPPHVAMSILAAVLKTPSTKGSIASTARQGEASIKVHKGLMTTRTLQGQDVLHAPTMSLDRALLLPQFSFVLQALLEGLFAHELCGSASHLQQGLPSRILHMSHELFHGKRLGRTATHQTWKLPLHLRQHRCWHVQQGHSPSVQTSSTHEMRFFALASLQQWRGRRRRKALEAFIQPFLIHAHHAGAAIPLRHPVLHQMSPEVGVREALAGRGSLLCIQLQDLMQQVSKMRVGMGRDGDLLAFHHFHQRWTSWSHLPSSFSSCLLCLRLRLRLCLRLSLERRNSKVEIEEEQTAGKDIRCWADLSTAHLRSHVRPGASSFTSTSSSSSTPTSNHGHGPCGSVAADVKVSQDGSLTPMLFAVPFVLLFVIPHLFPSSSTKMF